MLTLSENKVYVGVIAGQSNKAIAQDLNIKVNTVKFHLTSIYKKYNVTNRAQLIVKALTPTIEAIP